MMWVEFFLSAAVLIYAGTKLTVYGDLLADRMSLSKVWIGVILMAFITSLPESMTSLVAVIQFDANDLAAGNMLGSNNFNLMIIVLMDVVYRQGSVTNLIKVHRSHNWLAILSVILSGLVLADIFLLNRGIILSVGYMSLGLVLVAVTYVGGIKFLSTLRNEPSVPTVSPLVAAASKLTRGQLVARFVLFTLLVLASAHRLTHSGDMIARVTGLGETFVGSVFLALSTSLPEIVVSVSAVRIGSYDLAFGNIFGSNMVNMFILFLCSLFYTKGPLLETVSPAHMVTILLTLWLTAVIMVGVKTDKKKTFGRMGWDSLLMLGSFIIGMGCLYAVK